MTSVREWKPIESAPKDGTVLWGRNPQMKEPCKMRWGDYTASWGTTYTDWNTVFTEREFFPVRAGNLICPTEWKPAQESAES